jgi:hypothetical protein
MALDPRFWKYLGAIQHKKSTGPLDDPDFEKVYTPFMMNRALGHSDDTVLAANLMNERPGLDPRLQFHFLLNTVSPRYRKSEWMKAEVSDDVRDIAEYYECSVKHARSLVPLHSSDQLAQIRRRLEKGGAMKAGRRGSST